MCVPSSGIELSLCETHRRVFISFFNNTKSFLEAAVWCRPTCSMSNSCNVFKDSVCVYLCVCGRSGY